MIDELNQIFSASRTAPFDLYLINGHRDGQAHRAAMAFIREEVARAMIAEAGAPIIHSRWDVHWNDGRLTYINRSCDGDAAVAAPFFLHIIPADPADLPEHRKQHDFDNLDFRFQGQGGYRVGQTCVAVRELPYYDIRKIRTGQYTAEQGKIWKGNYDFER